MDTNHNATIARRIAAYNANLDTGKTWIKNASWNEAAGENWIRMGDGQQPYTIALPQPTDGQAIEDLINQGIVGVYQ